LALANNLVVWYYFEAFVIPTAKQNQLYNSDPALKRAIDNYEQAANVSAVTQNEILAQTLVVDATSAVLAAVVYAEIGAEVGAAIGSIVPVAGTTAGAIACALISTLFHIGADQFNAGGEFIINNDKASMLLTLGLTPLANNDNQIFLQSFSIYSGVYQIKHFVLGKGLAQNLGGVNRYSHTDGRKTVV